MIEYWLLSCASKEPGSVAGLSTWIILLLDSLPGFVDLKEAEAVPCLKTSSNIKLGR